MNKIYGRINWENYPSENTALNEHNLNQIDYAVDELDNRVVSMDATKFDKSTANSMVKDISYDETTGTFVVNYLNGVNYKLDTKLEKLAVNFSYNEKTQQLIITLDDGTVQNVDLRSLITQYEFLNSDTVTFGVNSDGKVSAEIINGSITEEKLQPKFLADIKVEVSKVEKLLKTSTEQALLSKSYAVGDTNTRDGEDIDNSKYYSQQSKTSSETSKQFSEEAISAVAEMNKKLKMADFDIDDDGNLIYTDHAAYKFRVDDDGNLNWEVA